MKKAGIRSSAGKSRQDQPASFTVGTTLLPRLTRESIWVQYANIGGRAVFEGDILLGSVDRVEDLAKLIRTEAMMASPGEKSLAKRLESIVVPRSLRWKDGVVPYTIAPGLGNDVRIPQAIDHWQAVTPIRFVRRTANNANQYPNFVQFVEGDICMADLGCLGGRQEVLVAPAGDCSAGSVIHEIGHTVGLYHEQSREDRDMFVIINWQNIEPGFELNFNQHVIDGDDVGPYDYESIMHYPRDAFSANGQDTIVPVSQGTQIGQRHALSAGDISAVVEMYTTRPPQ